MCLSNMRRLFMRVPVCVFLFCKLMCKHCGEQWASSDIETTTAAATKTYTIYQHTNKSVGGPCIFFSFILLFVDVFYRDSTYYWNNKTTKNHPASLHTHSKWGEQQEQGNLFDWMTGSESESEYNKYCVCACVRLFAYLPVAIWSYNTYYDI